MVSFLRASQARVVLCLIAIVCCPMLHAETYQVDGANGNDANDGVKAPFRTITRALQSLKISDTLVLTKMDAPYRESLPLRVGGTPERPLVVEGNGATLSGSDLASKTGWQANGAIHSVEQATEVKFLFGPEARYERGKSAAELEPEQWWWEDGKLFFRPAEGKTPADYDLEMSVRACGLATSGAGQIIVRNLTCKHFYNDGFNLHGGSAPVWFENIVGVWNGDEGFSAHENCECYVRGGEFSHNYWHGIADVNLARTHYANIVVRGNRSKGLYFIGGMHSVTDSEVSGSPTNIALAPSSRMDFPQFEHHGMRPCTANFRNVVVRSTEGQTGVEVGKDTSATIEHCLFSGGNVGVKVAEGGKTYVINSVIHGAATAEVIAAGLYAADHNLYFPGRLNVSDRSYGSDEFGAYQQATGNDTHSFLEEPKFIGDTLWTSRASHAKGKAFGGRGYGGMDIGIGPHGIRPDEDASVIPVDARRTAEGNILFAYDFEEHNPWSRVYPQPDRNQAGQAVEGTSELSDEQAHSGKRSTKLSVVLPPAAPPQFLVKLFSVKFAYDRPVCAVRYWLFGDGSGVTAKTRVRDRSGECFYDAPFAIDWSGWKQIAWDLEERPPAAIHSGDGNRTQDGPPMEIVCEIVTSAGDELVLYFDDLEVELAGDP